VNSIHGIAPFTHLSESPMTFKKIALTASAALLAGLSLACGAGNSSNSGGDTKNQPITTTGSKAVAKPRHNPNQITGDGTFAVPSQVKPGSYRAVVPQDSFGCYYERRKDATGEMSGIIANDNANPGSQVIVQIRSTDKYFKTEGCGTWTKVG
jgi:hypothetical protein